MTAPVTVEPHVYVWFVCLFPPLSTKRESTGLCVVHDFPAPGSKGPLGEYLVKTHRDSRTCQSNGPCRHTWSCLLHLSAASLLSLPAQNPPRLPGPLMTPTCFPRTSTACSSQSFPCTADRVQVLDMAMEAPQSGPSPHSRAPYTLIPEYWAYRGCHTSLYPLPFLPGGPLSFLSTRQAAIHTGASAQRPPPPRSPPDRHPSPCRSVGSTLC